MVTYGKALGGGLPMAMIGGRADVMAGLEWGKVLHLRHPQRRAAGAACDEGDAGPTMLAEDQAGFARIKDLGLKAMADRDPPCWPNHSNRHRHRGAGGQLDVPDLLHRQLIR
jgi:hypothetical protein